MMYDTFPFVFLHLSNFGIYSLHYVVFPHRDKTSPYKVHNVSRVFNHIHLVQREICSFSYFLNKNFRIQKGCVIRCLELE